MTRNSFARRIGVLAFAISAPFVFATAAQAEKAGQLCAKTKEGAKATATDGTPLTCKADGTRFRWTATGSAPAPTATKLAPASKTPTKTATKSSGASTKKASTASAGGGAAVKGRFCAKADDGRRAKNDKGENLVCKADNNGKNRWQLA